MIAPNVTAGEWTEGVEINICDQTNVGLNISFLHTSKPDRFAEGQANAKMLAASKELAEELCDAYEQHRCGCGHPHCKQCERDSGIRDVLLRAGYTDPDSINKE
jgi:hypothetical protein